MKLLVQEPQPVLNIYGTAEADSVLLPGQTS
jgi:hypothetical protein